MQTTHRTYSCYTYNYIVIPVILMGLALAGCQAQAATPTIAPTDEAAQKQVISVTGKIVPERWANLSFGLSGKVREIAVSEGQIVSKGQILAQLDTMDIDASIAQAEAALAAAQAQVAQLQAGPRPVDLRGAQVAVDLARDNVQAAEMAVSIADANIQAAQASLELAQATLKRIKAGPTADELEVARQNIELAKAERYALQGQRDAIGGTRKHSGYQTGSYEAAEGQVMAAEVSVTIAELNKRILETGARPEDIEVVRTQGKQAEAALLAAQAQKSAAQKQVAIGQRQVEQAQAQLDLLQAPVRAEELVIAETAVAQAEAALQSAKSLRDKAILRAPFAGTVAEVDLRPGEQVMAGNVVLSLGDLSTLRVETTDLDEIDVARVAEGRQVLLTFDALPDVQLQGKVQSIALKAGSGSGGTTYKAIITLDEGDPSLRWGMTAFGDIQTESAK